MKQLSLTLTSEMVTQRRKELHLSQTELAKRTGMNRSILSRLEGGSYTPSVNQLLALSAVLGFQTADVMEECGGAETELSNGLETEAGTSAEAGTNPPARRKIAVAGTGYVGLSLAVLFSQHNDVTAVDILDARVEQINRWESPIRDEYIERFMAEHEERGLSLRATTDGAAAYAAVP